MPSHHCQEKNIKFAVVSMGSMNKCKTQNQTRFIIWFSDFREVFVLRCLEGLSVKEVSIILNIPEGTVKTNLHRAKKKLIKALTDEDFLKP